jgi:hypothetical protein
MTRRAKILNNRNREQKKAILMNSVGEASIGRRIESFVSRLRIFVPEQFTNKVAGKLCDLNFRNPWRCWENRKFPLLRNGLVRFLDFVVVNDGYSDSIWKQRKALSLSCRGGVTIGRMMQSF